MSGQKEVKKVYFVRHGQSEINAHVLKTHINDRDAKLTQKGEEQSRFIARRVKQLPVDVVIASPYVRTAQTARFITEVTGHAVEFNELFIERKDPSSIVGMPTGDQKTKEFFRSWTETFYAPGKRIEDGENFDDISKRVGKALEYLERRQESNILVVTHGYFLRTLLARVIFGAAHTPELQRAFIGATQTDNTGITMITNEMRPYDDVDPEIAHWRLRIFNDHAHLG